MRLEAEKEAKRESVIKTDPLLEVKFHEMFLGVQNGTRSVPCIFDLTEDNEEWNVDVETAFEFVSVFPQDEDPDENAVEESAPSDLEDEDTE